MTRMTRGGRLRLRQGTRNETKSNHEIFEPTSNNFALRAKFIQFGVAMTGAIPFFSGVFLDNAFKIVPGRLKKRLTKKMSAHTHTHRENSARSGGRRDPVLDLRNGSPLASSLKKWLQNKLADSLNNPIKSTSGFFVRCTLLK